MSEQRFTLRTNSVSINYPSGRIFDNKKQHSLYLDEVVFVLNEQQATISALKEENEQLRRLFEEMKQPITINLTEEDEKELRKLLGLIDDE